jgi:hypothetical protein
MWQGCTDDDYDDVGSAALYLYDYKRGYKDV